MPRMKWRRVKRVCIVESLSFWRQPVGGASADLPLPAGKAPILLPAMEWITDPSHLISLLTLTGLEIVLGIDNIIFISILCAKLPAAQQGKARTVGLLLALVARVLLLCSIFLLTKLTRPLFSAFGHGFAGKDLVMIAGGIFLLWKSVREIHGSVESEESQRSSAVPGTFRAIVFQIVMIDIIFSLDSVITAVGVAREIGVMIAAVILAMGVTLWTGWVLWGVILLLPAMRHPHVPYFPLMPYNYRWLGLLALAILLLTLLPAPFVGTSVIDLFRS